MVGHRMRRDPNTLRSSRTARIARAGLSLIAGSLVFAGLAASTVSAQTDLGQIDAATSALLAPWIDHWDALPAVDRERLLSNARRWQAMTAEQRAAYLQRNAAWDALPPTERTQQRERYAAWQALSMAEQARVHSAAARFTALSVAQQQQLRVRFDALDREVQQGWLLGPARGAWIAQALPLFAYVPDGQRTATLAMLETLPEPAHAALLQLARRLPQPQRDQLRHRLLATPIFARAQLLQGELAR